MTTISILYRIGIFLLIAALLTFLFGDALSKLLVVPPPSTGAEPNSIGFGIGWANGLTYRLAATGTLLLVAAGIAEAWTTKPPPG